MTMIGCTGHQQMPPEARVYADREMRLLLASVGTSIVGVSSLAAGADQMFARAVRELGGRLHVFIPSDGYESTFSEAEDLRSYLQLLAEATTVATLPCPEPSEAAFLAAGKAVVDECDVLYAVWDGKPAQGLGGSADVVKYARSQGKAVQVVWPEGVSR